MQNKPLKAYNSTKKGKNKHKHFQFFEKRCISMRKMIFLPHYCFLPLVILLWNIFTLDFSGVDYGRLNCSFCSLRLLGQWFQPPCTYVFMFYSFQVELQILWGPEISILQSTWVKLIRGDAGPTQSGRVDNVLSSHRRHIVTLHKEDILQRDQAM